ncbi:SDR family NAD(P)-dependent oxidoreductase [Thermocoleostomius sinensis]|uniref:SDR family NAD(P)-dependent oxidoreductase n=1 Tax=Thermocoleostomius sinensis A174 TaxID=2016057 RepID=A0A9E9C9Q6_9CYAN|nr:SDR family oxidoreductase [Thermocoleostomius sinensis]WAL61893.1 SDR family NAD(P)-dependent oxidoreductase [Thermocoleostomius sinensis A174]
MIDLTGKTILVTGASRGIGAVTALTIEKAGASVILHYGQGQTDAESVAEQMESDRHCLIQADLSQPQAAESLWQAAINWQGKIDVIVNNAAVMPYVSVEESEDEWSRVWQMTLQVNLIAVADLCRLAIRHFQTRQGGTIINIASRAAFRGDAPNFMHYAASKGGVVALTRSIARGFAKDKVLAFAIAPGFVYTDRIAAMMQESGAEAITQDIPLGSPASPQDVANTIAFLSAGLAPHMTGATLDINGASYMR